MHKLQEPTVVVRCRKEDLSIVEGQVDSARKTFKSTFNIEAPTITVDKKTFLAPGPVPGVDGVYWYAFYQQSGSTLSTTVALGILTLLHFACAALAV